jgi:hypothetical protein
MVGICQQMFEQSESERVVDWNRSSFAALVTSEAKDQ